MKKIIILTLFVLSQLTFSASAELGVNVGVSVQVGEAEASGTETENGTKSVQRTEAMLFGTGSFFIEKTLDFLPGPLERLTVGFDHVPHDIGTGMASNVKADLKGKSTTSQSVNNSVKAEFSDLNTLYLTLRITDFLYLKGGSVSVDATSQEELGTGSSYGNASLDGEVYGIGLNHTADNGMFLRAEYNVMDIDGVTLTSTTNSANTVTLNGIDTESLKASIGRSF